MVDDTTTLAAARDDDRRAAERRVRRLERQVGLLDRHVYPRGGRSTASAETSND